MDTLLPWQQKQVLITLLFEGIRTSYLVHTFLEATAISGITCCYGYLVTIALLQWQQKEVLITLLFEGIGYHVTMATEAGAYNIAVGRYKDFILGAHIP